MKNIMSVNFILVVALLLIGCGTDPIKGIENAGKIENIPFERVTIDETPDDVRATIQYKNREKATYVLPSDDNYFIIVSRGEQPTSGYEVEILTIEDWGDSIHVFYKFKDPADDELVSPVITFPLDIVKIKRSNKQILFKLVEHENKRYKGIDINL